MTLTVTALNRFPVKSCRGEPLRSAVVEPWGLAGDRRWMVVDADGDVITAREVHQLLLVEPTLVEGGLRVVAPGLPELVVRTPDGSARATCRVWSSTVDVAAAGPEADAWFSAVTGVATRLVHLDDPTVRPTNPEYGRPDDRVSLADGYPLLLTTQESLDALNDVIAAGPFADEGPLPMLRFRPSVVVRGAPAWAEDDWRRIRVGSAEFRMVKACDRCVLTTLDPDTAAKGKEPLAALARARRRDGKIWFGVNLVPDVSPAAETRIRVGDEVTVLEAVPSGGGPLH